MSRKLKITLKEINVFENGVYDEEKEASNFFEALWIQPKTGVSAVRSILDLKLKDKEDFFASKLETEKGKIKLLKLSDEEEDQLKEQLDLEIAKTQLLLKQEIEADSFIEFNLGSIQKRNKLLSILEKIFGGAIKTAFGTIPGLGTVAKEAGSKSIESVFESRKPENDKLASIGRGVLKIDENILDGKQTVEKKINLYVPKDTQIRPFAYLRDEHGNYVPNKERTNPKVLNKGKHNGTITLEITEIK